MTLFGSPLKGFLGFVRLVSAFFGFRVFRASPIAPGVGAGVGGVGLGGGGGWGGGGSSAFSRVMSYSMMTRQPDLGSDLKESPNVLVA